jgi:hypothetical protein
VVCNFKNAERIVARLLWTHWFALAHGRIDPENAFFQEVSSFHFMNRLLQDAGSLHLRYALCSARTCRNFIFIFASSLVPVSERSLIDGVCRIGFQYHRVSSFVNENCASRGVYVRALCHGLTEVMSAYQALVLATEQLALDHANSSAFPLPLSRILLSLRPVCMRSAVLCFDLS